MMDKLLMAPYLGQIKGDLEIPELVLNPIT